jgi:hypothetical protein
MFPRSLLFYILLTSLSFAQKYQIGREWSRVPIFDRPAYKNIAGSVGEISSSATLFYIGKIKKYHYAITNAHVCSSYSDCENDFIEFFYHKSPSGEGLKGRVVKVALIEKSLDLALLKISFDNLKQIERLPLALRLSNQAVSTQEPLMILGYGIHENQYGTLTVGDDQDCRTFDNQVRKIADPDRINPIPYRVYSLPIGCDASHGDSGSPILHKKTGGVIGLLWTGKVPKHKSMQLDTFRKLPLKFLWSQLNYMVPAYLIRRKLEKFFKSQAMPN